MSATQVRVKLVEGFVSLGTAGSHSVTVDRPVELGGTGTGFRPSELLLLSLGSCLSTTLASAAKTREITLTNVVIQVTGQTQPNPERFTDFEVEVALSGTNSAGVALNDVEIEKLLQIAERGCFITNTLKVGANITLKRVQAPELTAAG